MYNLDDPIATYTRRFEKQYFVLECVQCSILCNIFVFHTFKLYCTGVQHLLYNYICMYVCVYVCIHVCMYVCMCMYVCTYVCMYVCMCVYIAVHILKMADVSRNV